METAANKDTGFAWIVLIASFMGHFFQYGIVWSVGYFYVIFLEHFDGSKAAVALIASLNTATYYCIGMCKFMQIIYSRKILQEIACRNDFTLSVSQEQTSRSCNLPICPT